MSNADAYWLTACFTIVTAILLGVRDRLKRIEKKLDSLAKLQK
jgi:hypothetical protein